ncbi:MAG: alginate lyase family protein [Lentisphaerae bacterium]|jgi:hypothetical protein|nr:alginate lyase family protein [Lentisphaerota bacterium]MBT5613048.1 alginate lyase family protein [Lentisphaerota bacterium]MBT7056706.1 alginate lyase family protein [Lentisphaerota bacterium]MBT7843776.1 alginate lyase family protein [Lentisphaerota bacterium]
MRFSVAITLLLCLSARATQPSEIRAMATQLVPKVRVGDAADFFAAWDLERPGMAAVKAAVAAGELTQAEAALKEYFLERRQPEWRLNHWEMPKKPKGRAEEHSRYQQGEEVLAHVFDGHQFGEMIDWNCYPKKKPDGTPDTEFSPSPVTFKHATNVLGRLYWYSLDEKYAKEFVDEVTDFVTRYPAPETYRSYGPCMWSRLRAVSPLCGTWFDCYNYFLRSKHFTPEAHAIMLRGFIEKVRYAVRNPDRVNRYWAQLRGIYATGCYFPELKQAQGFRELAVAAMMAAIKEEFYPDTSDKELCPGYHGMYLSALYGFVENARVMGYDASPELQAAFESCAEFYTKMATPLHGLPQFGDTGSKSSLTKVFRNNIAPFVDSSAVLWFASKGGKGAPPDFRSIRLPYAGFYVMRSGWDENARYLCFDAGPLGKGHFHEDANNFECYAYGERLVADMGTYSYTFGKWRQYFVSSLAHNVVLVDGLGQNRAGSPPRPGLRTADGPREHDWHSDEVFDLAWGHYDARWVDWRDSGHWFNHYGKDKAVDLAAHRRDICFVKDSYWIVSDRLTAEGTHTYSQLFHFEPGRTANVVSPGHARTLDPGRANIVIMQADPIAGQVVVGQEDPPRGWYSAGKFERAPAPELRFEQKGTDRVAFDTVLLPLDVGEDADVTATRVPVRDEDGNPVGVHDVCALRIEGPFGTHYYINDLRQAEIGPANGRVKVAGPVRTDARAAVVRLSREGALLKASASGASVIELDGRMIWQQ